MPERDFFIHNGNQISMKYLRLEFTLKATVTNIFYNVPQSPISFGPRNHNDELVLIAFLLNEIGGTTHNIGVTIEYAQGDKPQLKNAVWMTIDNKEYPLSRSDIDAINKHYLYHG